MLQKKKNRDESDDDHKKEVQQIIREEEAGEGSETRPLKQRKEAKNESDDINNIDKSISNLDLNEQDDQSIVNSDENEIRNLKDNLLKEGKGSKKQKLKVTSVDSGTLKRKKINLEPVLDNINYEKNINYKKFKSEEERINIYDNLNRIEEDFFVKYLKDKIKNDQPFRILFEVSQKCKFNTPEIIINPIGKNDQFSVKIFISDFYFYGDGLAQSKKEGKSN